MIHRIVTNQEVKEWNMIRGWRQCDIAELYGYSVATIQYHTQPERAKIKRRAQWREHKQRVRSTT